MPSADADAPCDRPNLSKDYLAGTADEGWIPLQGPEFYAEHDIDLRLGCEVTAIDAAARQVHLGTGERLDYGALLLATDRKRVMYGKSVSVRVDRGGRRSIKKKK